MDFREDFNTLECLKLAGFNPVIVSLMEQVDGETHKIHLSSSNDKKDLIKVLSGNINDLNLQFNPENTYAYIEVL